MQSWRSLQNIHLCMSSVACQVRLCGTTCTCSPAHALIVCISPPLLVFAAADHGATQYSDRLCCVLCSAALIAALAVACDKSALTACATAQDQGWRIDFQTCLSYQSPFACVVGVAGTITSIGSSSRTLSQLYS